MELEPDEKIEMVLEWAKDKPKFDTEFIESLNEFFENNGHLTESQEDALDNIIHKWGIE